MSKCRVCGIELTDENWYAGFKKTNNRICRACHNKKVRDWQEQNRESSKERNRIRAAERYKKNPEKYREYAKNYHRLPHVKKQDHNRYKKYFAENRDAYLEYWAKRKGKGYVPLNDYFEGSDGHHIDNEQVVFMPMFIHRAIPHRHDNAPTMQTVNLWALFWLLYGDAKTVEMKIPDWVFKSTEGHKQLTLF